jgi:hypothetical protein
MKAFLIAFLIFPVTLFSQDYYSAYQEGYKKGYCFEDFGCTPPNPPNSPTPRSGFDSYEDGYNRGFSDGKAAKQKNQKSSSQKTSNNYELPKFERNYTSNSSGAYSNPQAVVDNSGSVFADAISSFGNNFSSAINSRPRKALKNEVVTDLKVDLNAFKYIVFNKLIKEGSVSTSGLIKNKVLKRLSKSNYNVVDISEKKQHKNDPIPNDLNEDPTIGLYASLRVKNNFGSSIEVRLELFDSNEDLVYEKFSVSTSSWGVADKVSSELASKNHNYDPSLEKYLPIILSDEEKIAIQKAIDSKKEYALNEIKRLKELLDLELISKEEFEEKSKEFKEIILAN